MSAVAASVALLREAVRNSSLAIALVQLPTRRFVELSPRAAALLGSEPLVLQGTDSLAISHEPEASGRAWDVIADRVVDGYHARRMLRGRDGAVDSRLWVRVLQRTDTDTVADVVVIATPVREPASDGGDHETLPNDRSLEFLLVPLLDIVHSDDIATILTAIEDATTNRAQVAVVVRVRHEARSWQRSRLSLGPIDEETKQFGFAITPAGEPTALVAPGERVVELEQRLRRIAREVEAAGVVSTVGRLPDAETLPGLEDLTSRQWEVATRLARGERVSEIARGMYLSPSTVRNHLANLFRKVGVHSQSEFLDLFRQQD